MGVRRAVEMVLDAPKMHEEPIFTFGPLIHNLQVLELLEEKGITILDKIPANQSGTVIIRAHGVPPKKIIELEKAGFNVIDATCPRVIKVQILIKRHVEKGYAAIIVGDEDHPEVIGLLGYAKDQGYVLGSNESLDSLPSFEKAIVVAQTTQNKILFADIKDRIERKYPHYIIYDTICDSTIKRQAEVRALDADVDAFVVVGGLNSGNTKRLVETAQESGKPTYHIETEADLNDSSLESANHVGITAGASTPKWVINRVFRTIEKIPLRKGRTWLKALFNIQQALLLTNIYVALGAASLCYACASLQGIQDFSHWAQISMFYILSMHTLNNLIKSKTDIYNDPGRALFYKKYRSVLVFLAVLTGALGLIIAYRTGPKPFGLLLVMSILGLSYNFKLMPNLKKGRNYSLQDFPGSKTVLITLAWGVVTALFPFFGLDSPIHMNTVIVFLWSVCIVFVRTAFFDILDMQGDRIVGKSTIPLIFGEKNTLRFLKRTLVAVILLVTLFTAFEFIPTLGIALTACPILLLVILYAHEQGNMLPGIRLEFIVESQFILTGLITALWAIAS